MKAKRFFLYNLIAFVFALQIVIVTNYWVFVFKNAAYSAVNDTIPYNGQIYDSSNSGLNGEYKMRMNVYNALSGGTLLWTEEWDGTDQNTGVAGVQGDTVTITGGVFFVELNSLCGSWTGGCATGGGVTFNEGTIYLQVELDVDGNGAYEEIFTPRKRFSTAAYANNSDSVDGSGVGTSGATIPMLSNASTWSGVLTWDLPALFKTGIIITGAPSQSANLFEFTTNDAATNTLINENAEIETDEMITNELTYVRGGKRPSESTTGIVAYWPFDEGSGTTANDIVSTNDGTISNAVYNGTGYFWYSTDDSLVFDGDADYVTVADADALSFGDGFIDEAMSASVWAYHESTTDEGLMSKYNVFTTQREWSLWSEVSGGKIYYRFAVYDESTDGYLQKDTPAVYDIDEWHHVVATYDGLGLATGLKIYVNGVRADTVNSSSGTYVAMENTTAPVTLGMYTDTGNALSDLEGKLDNAILYNIELTDSQIQSQHFSALGQVQNLPSLADSKIVSYWQLDEGIGSTAIDRVGSNDGTITNATFTDSGAFEYTTTNALSFDGDGDYVSIPDSVSNSLSTVMSLETWVYQDALSVDKTILSKWEHGTQNSWAVQTDSSDNTKLKIVIASSLTDNETVYATTPTSSWTASAWHHVVVVYNGAGSANADRLQVYIDGVAQTLSFTGTIPASLTDSTASLRFGSHSGSLTRYWNGDIDTVVMYARALTADNAKKNYNIRLQKDHAVAFDTSFTNTTSTTLFGIKNNDTEVVTFDISGTANLTGLLSTGQMLLSPLTNIVPLSIKAYSSQTANLTEFVDKTSARVAYVDASGDFIAPQTSVNNAISAQVTGANTFSGLVPSTSDANIVSYHKFDDNKRPLPITETGIVGNWDFDEGAGITAVDSVGGFDGTLSGATWNGSGYFGYTGDNAVVFDGTNDTVNLGNSVANFGDDMSMVMWLNPDTTQTNSYARIISNHNNNNAGFAIEQNAANNNQYYFFWYSSGSVQNGTGSTFTLTGNTWSQVTVVLDTSNAKVYVNGSEVVSVSGAGAMVASSENLNLGTWTVDTTKYWKGKMDNLVIFDTALTVAQVGRYYNMGLNTVAADYVNSYNATPTNNAAFSTADTYFDYTGDHVITFDGTDDYVNIPDNDAFTFNTGGQDQPFSVEYWVKFNTLPTDAATVAKWSSSAVGYEWIVYMTTSGKISFQMYGNSTSTYISRSKTTAFATGAWYHVVATYDGSETAAGIKIYVNGVQVDDTTTTGGSYTGMTNTTAPVTIGAYYYISAWQEINGLMDNVVIYNDVVTAEEALLHYTQGVDGGSPSLITDTENNFANETSKIFSVRNKGVEKLYSQNNTLGFTEGADKSIEVARTTGSTGYDLTIGGGGAVKGGTNLNGGDLTIATGIATGNASSVIDFQISPAGSSGTSDNSLVSILSINGDGSVRVADNRELRIYDGIYYVGFTAPTLAANKIWTLPAVDGSGGSVFGTNGSAALSFAYKNSSSRTAVTTSSHSASSSDQLIGVNYNGSVAITLPTPTSGKVIIVKDEGGFGGITVSPNASELIDGASSASITAYGKKSFISDGTNWYSF